MLPQREAFFFSGGTFASVAIQRLPITEFLRQCRAGILLDVRSPGEYGHAHIPGAISFPLFSDEERKVVGTAYKQQGRQTAIRIGLDYFGPKMRGMVEQVEALMRKDDSSQTTDNSMKPTVDSRPSSAVFVHCWRGGMRSGAIAWLLDLYGFKVATLAGGYKAFRNAVLRSFEQPYPFRILGGFTGSGKTEVLQALQSDGQAVIDLEALACHKGSAFGNYNMPPQPSQEMFENRLAWALWEQSGIESPWAGASNSEEKPIWLEDESQRIGNLNIPAALWQTMRQAPISFLEVPFDERLEYIVQHYGSCSVEKLSGSVQRISKRLGGLETKNALAFLEEGNQREAFRILLHYYDKRYLKGLHSRSNWETLLTRVPCEKAGALNASALSKYQTA